MKTAKFELTIHFLHDFRSMSLNVKKHAVEGKLAQPLIWHDQLK